MGGTHEFPCVFTVEGSARHEIILINPGHDLNELRNSIETLVGTSPNCAEFMSKYKKKGDAETVTELKVHWAAEGRDSKLFPKETILTEDNCEAVLRMLAIGVGKDVLDVKLKKQTTEEGDKKQSKEDGDKK